MAWKTQKVSQPVLGFLTVLEHPQHGLFGGYLLLNLAGRPVEFHCTAPVKPNRAQQILYGPRWIRFSTASRSELPCWGMRNRVRWPFAPIASRCWRLAT